MNAAVCHPRSLCSTETHWVHAPATWLFLLGMATMTFTFDTERFGGVVAVGVPFLLAGCGLAILAVPYLSAKYARYVWPALGYIFSIVCSVWFISGDLTAPAVRIGAQLVGFALFLYMLRTLQNDSVDGPVTRAWTDGLAIAGLVMALHYLGNIAILVVEGRIGEAIYQRYIGGLMSLDWGASNTVASALLPPLAAALVALVSFGRRWWLMQLIPAVILACILATFSRGALAAILAAAMLYLMLMRRVKALLIAMVWAALAAGVLVWAIGLEQVMTYIDLRQMDAATPYELNGRMDIWTQAWRIIVDEFPMPIGYYGSVGWLGHSPHNLILIYLLEIGFWGLGTFLWFHAIVAGDLLRQRSKLSVRENPATAKALFLCGMAAMLLHLMVEDAQYTQPYAVYYWAFMALAVHQAVSTPRRRPIVATAPADNLPLIQTTWHRSM